MEEVEEEEVKEEVVKGDAAQCLIVLAGPQSAANGDIVRPLASLMVIPMQENVPLLLIVLNGLLTALHSDSAEKLSSWELEELDNNSIL